MSTRRVLVTGASGLLGRAVYQTFHQDPAWEAVGLAYSRTKGDLRKVDLTDADQVQHIMEDVKPAVVIHAAAERRPDVVENQADATQRLNLDATRNVCQLAAQQRALVVFISTDYVFDGNNAPYSIEAQPNPLNKYGRSKLQGEKLVTQSNTDNVILRVPVLYGDVEYLDESAITTLFAKVKDVTTPSPMCNYQRRYPTHVMDVARVILDLTNRRLQDKTLTGIFHWSGDECMTKHEMAVTMAAIFRLPSSHLVEDMSAVAGSTIRPYDAHLDTSRLEALGIVHRRAFRTAIQSCLQPYA